MNARALTAILLALGLVVPIRCPAAGKPVSPKAPAAVAMPTGAGFHDFASLTSELGRLSGPVPIRRVSLGRSAQGRDLWVVAVGADAALLAPPSGHLGEIREDAAKHPGLLVVGGTDATQLAGSEEALRILQRLAAEAGSVDSIGRALAQSTVYVVPRISPDACERFFQRPQLQRTTNLEPWDEDRDGRVDEDAPQDLNGDGLITWMRVEDPDGEWMPDPRDPRLLRRADRSKGEVGRYRLHVEGRDLDHDGRFAEDGAGGLDFSRNWSYGYKPFTEGAGGDPMTAVEVRALADFLFDHASISAVLILGAQDNLLEPWKADPSQSALFPTGGVPARRRRSDFDESYGGNTSGQSAGNAARGGGGGPRGGGEGGPPSDPIVRSPGPLDAPIFEFVSRRYQEITGLYGAPPAVRAEGDFGSWAYYHFGRLAWTARPWWPMRADSAAPKEAGKPGKPDGAGDGPSAGPRAAMGRGGRPGPGGASASGSNAPGGSEDADQAFEDLRALESLHVDAFVPWSPVNHPDLPGRRVEVGGFRPYVRTVPPGGALDSLAAKSGTFALDLLRRLPRVMLRGARVERLGSGLYRVSVSVANTGYLPSVSQVGTMARWPRQVRARIEGAGVNLVEGHALELLDPIAGSGGSQEVSWLVSGAQGARVRISADSPMCGSAAEEVQLP